MSAIVRVGVDLAKRVIQVHAVDGNGRPIRFRKDMEKVRRFVAAARNCGGGVQGN